ncbi:MAG: hypothetical protein QM576_15470 [Rhodopseudomonas sp.]|uniref:hypothetical protein n=1 Tax=Rhodopseudomonas sp. TaxID=1078 RepID=UPI0039E6B370
MAKASKTKKARSTKAKSTKAKATKVKAARKEANKPVTPVYLNPPATIRIGLHDVIRALKMIETQGHLNKLVSGSKRQRLQVTLPAETVNFVKDFVVKHRMHTHRVGRHIVGGLGTASARDTDRLLARIDAGSDPNQCEFGKQG